MPELRKTDGTLRWRGDDPADAHAAILALGDEAKDCSLHGLDSTDLESVLPDAPSPEDSDAQRAKKERARKGTLDKLAKQQVDLIEDPAPDSYIITNGETGAREQVFDNPDDARRACERLNASGVKERGIPVTFRVERVSGLVLP